MSTDIAELGFAIRSDGVVVAADRLEDLERQSRRNERASEGLIRRFRELSVAAAQYAAALAAVAGALALREYLKFEEALTEVEKQTGLTGKALVSFRNEIDKLAVKIPGTSTDLLKIAAAAAQVGVTSTSDLVKFSAVVSKLGIASDVSGEQAVVGLAKVLNITGEAFSSVDTLASVLVRLGGASTAAESELLDFSKRLARAGALAGLSSSQVLALASTLIDIGVEAEAGSSTILKSFQQIEKAIQEGGKNAQMLSKLTGIAEKDLQRAFGENALQFLLQFLEGLNKVERQTGRSEDVLRQFGLNGEEVMAILPPLAQNTERLGAAMKAANDEVKNATALDNEYQRRLDDLGISVDNLIEKIKRLGVVIVGEFHSSIQSFVDDTAAAIGVVTNLINTTQEEMLRASITSMTQALDMLRTKYRDIVDTQGEHSQAAVRTASVISVLEKKAASLNAELAKVAGGGLAQRLLQTDEVVARVSKDMDAYVKAWQKYQNELKGAEEVENATQSYQKLKEELEFQISILGKTANEVLVLTKLRQLDANATDAQRKEIKKLLEVLVNAKAAIDKQKEAVQQWRHEAEEARRTRVALREEVERSARAEAQLAGELDTLARGLVETYNKTRQLEEAQALLTKAVKAGNLTVIEADYLYHALAKSQTESIKSAEDFNQTLVQMPNIAQAAAFGIQNAFSDTFENIFRHGIDGFKGFFDSIKDLFLRLLSQMLAAWASSGLMNLLRGGTSGAMAGGKQSAMGGMGMLNPSMLGGASGLRDSVINMGMESGLGPNTATYLGMGAGALGAGLLGMGAGNIIGGLMGGRGKLGGSIGGGLGAAIGTFTGMGPIIGGLIGSIFGGFLGSLFESVKGSLKLRTSADNTGFDHGGRAFAKGPFGYVGPDTRSHDLNEIQKGLGEIIANRIKTFDEAVAAFMTSDQITKVTEGLQSAETLKAKLGQKMSEGEFARVLADRAITILQSLDIAVPEILRQAMATEDYSPDEVKMALVKALASHVEGLNADLAKLIENFSGTYDELTKFTQVVFAVNKMLPGLNAVFGNQDPAAYVKAAQNMGGADVLNAKATEFASFFGFLGDMSKANAAELKKTMNTQLKALHTTRETFLADFEKAKAGGLTAEELQKWVEAGLAIKHVVDAAAQLKNFMSGFQDELMKDSLSEFQYSMYQLNQSFDAAMKQAKDLGASTQQLGVIQGAYHQRQQQLISNLENSIRSLVEQLFIQPELQATTTKLNDINQKIKDTQSGIDNASTEMGAIVGRYRLGQLQKEKEGLEAKQAELQKRLEKSQDISLAQKLAQQIADLSNARDISFSKIAQQFGFSLDDLAEKLGMSRGQLDDYLKGLQETNYTLPQLSDQFDKMLTPHFLALIKAVGGQPLPEDASAEEVGAHAYTRGMVNPDNSLIDVSYALHSGATDMLKSANTQLDAAKSMKDSSQAAKEAGAMMLNAAQQIFQAAQEGKNITITLEHTESAVGI